MIRTVTARSMPITPLEYGIVEINLRLNLTMRLNPTVRLSVFLKH